MCAKIIYKDNQISDELLTFQIGELIDYFRERNLFQGDIVAFKANSYYDTIIHWLACLRTGIIPLFIPFDYHNDLIKDIIDGIQVKGIIITQQQQHTFTELSANEKVHGSVDYNLEQGSILHITSATTGIPKIVIRTKKQLDCEIDRYISQMAFDEKDVFFPIVPLCHSFGFVCSLLTALKCDATIVISDLILPRNCIQMCNKHHVTTLLGVPHFYEKMISLSDLYKFNENMRYVISSCGPLDSRLKLHFEQKFSLSLTQMYGSTETGSLAISNAGDEANVFSRFFNGVDYFIKDDEIDGLPWVYIKTPDTIGRYFKSNHVMDVQDDYIKMGDLGSITDNHKLRILGRGDDVVIVSGKKFSIKKVEDLLKNNPDIIQFHLYKNKGNGELTCDYISDLSPYSLREFCRKYLLEYQIPKHFNKVDSIQSKHVTWKNKI